MNRFLMLSGVLFLGACSSDDEPEVTRGDFCRDWAEGACSTETVSRCQASDEEACRTSQEAYCLELVPTSFDPAESGRCLSAVRSAYRDGDLDIEDLRVVQRLDAPCDRLVRGPGAEGAICSDDQDCATPDGFECIRKAGAAMGTCETPEPTTAGQSCAAAQRVCSGANYCNGANCIAYEVLGADCTYDDACGPEARCDAGVCAERQGIGTTCESDEDCASNFCFSYADEPRTCLDRLVLSRAEPFCAALR